MLLIAYLELVVFTLHLIAVDVAAALPLFCIAVRFATRHDEQRPYTQLGRRMAGWSLALLLIGVVLGLIAAALLALADDGRFFAGLRSVPPRRIGFGVAEIVFSFVILLLYWRLWATRLPNWLHSLLALASATNLLYHFPVLFTVIAEAGVARNLPQDAAGYVDVVPAMLLPSIWPRIVHHVVAAIVVAGTFAMWIAYRCDNDIVPPRTAAIVAWSARVCLIVTVAQVLLGAYLLMRVTPDVRDQLLGRDVGAALSLGGSIVVSLALMHHLAAAAWGETSATVARRCLLLSGFTVLLMAAARHRTLAARQTTLPQLHTRQAHASRTVERRVGDAGGQLSHQKGIKANAL